MSTETCKRGTGGDYRGGWQPAALPFMPSHQSTVCHHSRASLSSSLPRPCSYILNVKCNDYSPDQLWQMRIVCDPFKWTTLAFPFSEFVLTKRGHVAINQSPLSLDSVGGVSTGRGMEAAPRVWCRGAGIVSGLAFCTPLPLASLSLSPSPSSSSSLPHPAVWHPAGRWQERPLQAGDAVPACH